MVLPPVQLPDLINQIPHLVNQVPAEASNFGVELYSSANVTQILRKYLIYPFLHYAAGTKKCDQGAYYV